MTFREQITVRTNPAVQFSLDRIEVAGRLADGEPPVQLREDKLNVTRTAGAGSAELMNAVMPLVDTAAATGAERPYDGVRVMAFNLFGQGIAFFQSAQTLIAGSQPAEALPSLRGLTLIAARFEQMSDPEGPGLGIVPRMVVDSIDQTRAESTSIEHARMTVHQVADQAGIVIPYGLPDLEETGIYKSLLTEMRLAESASDGGYGIVGLHLQTGPEQPGFHTKRQPDSFTDMIASACVIAQLDLLKRAAILFDWSLNATRADELLAKAITINDAAARGETSTANVGQPDQGPVLT
jgi:hypothetical protein